MHIVTCPNQNAHLKVLNNLALHALGLYNAGGDHYAHTFQNPGTNDIGLDLHHDIGGVLEPVFSEDGVYSTVLFAEEAVKVIQNHDNSKVSFNKFVHCKQKVSQS